MKRSTYVARHVLLTVIVLCTALFLAACGPADFGAAPEPPDGQPSISEVQADRSSDAPTASAAASLGAEVGDTRTDPVPAVSTEIVDAQAEAAPTVKQGQGGSGNAEETTEYSWQDGDRTQTDTLQPDLIVDEDASADSKIIVDVQAEATPTVKQGKGGSGNAEGITEYSWQDGDRTQTVTLQPDLIVDEDASADSKSGGGAGAPRGAIVRSPEGQDLKNGQPVFKSQSGALMTLPGGVLVVLNADWTAAEVNTFFASNGIKQTGVSELDFVDNGFFIETDPGFPSLDLANELASHEGVIISSPNWWTEVTTK